MTLLSIGDLSQVTGVSSFTIRNWMQSQVLVPAKPSRGNGSFHLYSLNQAVAVLIAAKCDEADARLSLALMETLFAEIGGMSEAQLTTALQAGRKHWVPIVNRLIKLDKASSTDCLDVTKARTEVKKVIATLSPKRRGRTTALALHN
ncbi:MerR family transcriptional regulator [Neorhodopirellula lusitana]|uniref:MerR family transcriptional regulator n=1 Tax=Neorhodopirellula lusitana TaxID=445327 RepID=UPI00384C5DA6